MRNVYDCVEAFGKLLDKEYHLVLGRKIFLFLAENGMEGKYFCRSFFPQDKMDYTKNQASWTLLYKKKVTFSTGEEEILYDRLRN